MSFRERGEDFVFKERVYTTVKDLVFRVEDAHKKIRGSEVKRFRFYIIILEFKSRSYHISQYKIYNTSVLPSHVKLI